MIIKRSIRAALSSLLLLCFSVSVLPLDFFHNHTAELTVCNQDVKRSSCQHKVHVAKKAATCIACTVHFDKSFTLSNPTIAYIEPVKTEISTQPFLAANTSSTTLSFPRGPPVT